MSNINKQLVKNIYFESIAYMEDTSLGLGVAPAWKWEEKFVELIVKECISTMEKEDSYYGSWLGKVVREHFGIES